jgi:hypothetical protein
MSGPIKLWVDDIRRPPDETWKWARTNDAAREILAGGLVEEASLDHDMGHHDRDPDDEDSIFLRGDSEDDGVQLAKWMIARRVVPGKISIHSWNPVGAENMKALLKPYCGDVTLKPYELKKCPNCKKRDATIVTDHRVKWCEICVLNSQIVFAEERAAALPGLRDKLQIAKAKAKEV